MVASDPQLDNRPTGCNEPSACRVPRTSACGRTLTRPTPRADFLVWASGSAGERPCPRRPLPPPSQTGVTTTGGAGLAARRPAARRPGARPARSADASCRHSAQLLLQLVDLVPQPSGELELQFL